MRITDAIAAQSRATDMITDARADYRILRGGRDADPQIAVIVGCETWTFRLGRDAAWRLAFTSTYGNTAFVTGAGCDASGFVVTDPALRSLLDTGLAAA